MTESAVTFTNNSDAIDIANKLLAMKTPELVYKESQQQEYLCTVYQKDTRWIVAPPKLKVHEPHATFHTQKPKITATDIKDTQLELVPISIRDKTTRTEVETNIDGSVQSGLKSSSFTGTSGDANTTSKTEATALKADCQTDFLQQVEHTLNSGHYWLKYIECNSKRAEKPPIIEKSIDNLSTEEKNKLLNFAIENDELDLFKALTRNKTTDELNELIIAGGTTDKTSLCRCVVESQAVEIMGHLAGRGYDLTTEIDSEGSSPLVFAIKHQRTKSLEKLLQLNLQKLDELSTSLGHSLLRLTIDNDDLSSIELLINAGLNVNQLCTEETTTLLKYAILKNKTHVIPLLIEHSTNLDHEDTAGEHKGSSALELAAKQGQSATVDLLISKKPELRESSIPKVWQLLGWGERSFDRVTRASEHKCPHILKLLLGRVPKEIDNVEELELHRLTEKRFDTPLTHSDITRLSQQGIAINFKNAEGFTPLQMAIKNNNIQAATALIEAGADITELTCTEKERDKDFVFNSLCLACHLGRTEIVKNLILHLEKVEGFDINAPRQGTWHTPMALATRGNFLVLAKYLHEHSATVHEFYGGGDINTPIKLAIHFKHKEMARWMMEQTKDYEHKTLSGEYQGFTCLDFAAETKQFDIFEELLAHGAQLNGSKHQKNNLKKLGWGEHDFEILTGASEHQYPQIIEIVIGRQPKANCQVEELELHRLTQTTFDNPTAYHQIQSLAKAENVNVNFKNAEGFTPLQMAIKNNNIQAAKALVKEAGADILEITCKGETLNRGHTFNSLSLACSLGRTEIVEILIVHLNETSDFNINSAREGTWHTPMILAARCNHLSLAKLLCKYNATVNEDCNSSTFFTPIKLAIHFKYKEMVRWMMEQTTDFEHQNKSGDDEGYTCLDFAAKTEQFDIFEELLTHDAQINGSKHQKNNLKKLGWGKHEFNILTRASEHQCPHIIALIIDRKLDDSGVIAELEIHRLASKEFNNPSVPNDIAKALKQQPNINFQNPEGNTPLQAAMKNNNVSAAVTLINANADLNTLKNNKDQTALMLACEMGNPEIVKLILEKVLETTLISALDEQTDNAGLGLVATAALHGHLPILKLLSQHQASLDKECAGNHNTPLKLSIASGHDETTLWLIDKLAFDNTEAIEEEGKGEDDQVVILGLKPTGKLDHQNTLGAYGGYTALDTAAQRKDLKIVEMLLALGADKKQCKTQIFEVLGFGENDYEVLKNASERRCVTIVKQCISRDPNPNFIIEELELHRLVEFDNQYTADLISKHAKVPNVNINFKNANGDTPLQAAIKASNIHAAKALIAAGADLNTVKDNKGRSSFAVACIWGSAEIVELFIQELKKDYSFDINAQLRDNWYTPMGLAANNNLVSVAKVLKKHEATIYAPCRNPSNTPIKIAISEGKSDVAMWLISQATVDELNEPNTVSAQHSEFGFTALDYAAKNKNYKLVDKLYQHGATQAKTDVLAQLDWGETNYSRLQHASAYRCLYIMQHIVNRELLSTRNIAELELHDIAAKNERPSRSKLVALGKSNVNLEFTDTEGYTPLNRAVENGHLKAVKVLLELGAKPDCQENNYNRNAIQTAAFGNHPLELQALLNKFDGDIEAAKPSDGSEWTTFALAINRGNIEIAKILVAHDPTLLERFEKGSDTHLMLALTYNQTEFASWLISKGVDTLKCNNKGETVVHWMIDNDKLDLLDTIIMVKSEYHLNREKQTPAEYAQALGNEALAARISALKKPLIADFELIEEDDGIEMTSVKV